MTMTTRRRTTAKRKATPVEAATPAAVTPATALGNVPPGLRDPLLDALNEIAMNFAAHKWEPSELNGGKLCEAAYTILRSYVDGTWAARPNKPRDFRAACLDFEQADKTTFGQSVRITTPRFLMAFYEIRNNRGVGHAGSDVNPNHMDATLVLAGAKWIVAELIRILHNTSTTEATAVVDALVERVVPSIWSIGTTRRVMSPGISMKDQTLLFLYGSSGWVAEADLVSWVEHSNIYVYRRDVLVRMHKDRLIEYEDDSRRAHITPLGIAYVETKLKAHLVA